MIIIKPEAQSIISRLQADSHQAYLVGGCVRDRLLGLEPAEWDITTSAKPEEVSRLFEKVIPTGLDFGTVTVLLNNQPYEVTTFRADGRYVDGRHPVNVAFTSDLHQDLSRRDFTINALAYNPTTQELIDDHHGQVDLKKKIIRTVGQPLERFAEDGLRPLRACRLAAKLGFEIEPETFAAIAKTLAVFKKVTPERVRDELVKLLSAEKPSLGLELMRRSGLLNIVLPELESCYGVSQPPAFHPHDVYWHSLYSCDAAPKDNLIVRLSALLHDIGKPACKVDDTFYNHDKVGVDLTETLLKRLKFSNDDIKRVANLIGNHMFDYQSGWSDAAVRRFMRRIGGVANAVDLFALRKADSQAMLAKEIGVDYLIELQQRIDKVIAEENALHITDLKVNGLDVMQTLKIQPGPKVGQVLNSLLEKVLDDPKLNEREILLRLIHENS